MLANIPSIAPENEGGIRAAVRPIINGIDRVERTAEGFRVALNQEQVSASIKGFKVVVKNNATISIDATAEDKIKLNSRKTWVGPVPNVNVSIVGNKLYLPPIPIPIPLVRESAPADSEDAVSRKSGAGDLPRIAVEQGMARGFDEASPSVADELQRAGAPLSREARSFFEPRFGVDLGGVRVHTDEQAAKSAQSIDAHAYASGQDIVFAPNRYQPGSAAGKQLLAHELVHVMQQTGGQSPCDHAQSSQPVMRSSGQYDRANFKEKTVAATAPASISIVLELADDAEIRASRWATSTWPGDASIRLHSLNRGVADAHRHAYWSATMALALGERLARRWATAHEGPVKRLEGEDNLLAEMDLFNNAVGRQIASNMKAEAISTSRHLEQAVRDEAWSRVETASIMGKLRAAAIEQDASGNWRMTTTADTFAF